MIRVLFFWNHCLGFFGKILSGWVCCVIWRLIGFIRPDQPLVKFLRSGHEVRVGIGWEGVTHDLSYFDMLYELRVESFTSENQFNKIHTIVYLPRRFMNSETKKKGRRGVKRVWKGAVIVGWAWSSLLAFVCPCSCWLCSSQCSRLYFPGIQSVTLYLWFY